MSEDHRILLVEDNDDDVALTRRALDQSNIANELSVARDGVEAMEHLFGAEGKEPGPLPQLVLLDLQLPRLDGLEVLEQIRKRERTRLLPVVVLTSSDEGRDRIQSYELGVNSYIRKPVDFNQFVDAVRQLGLYWLVLNRSPLGDEV